jgi:hypothetical protein
MASMLCDISSTWREEQLEQGSGLTIAMAESRNELSAR